MPAGVDAEADIGIGISGRGHDVPQIPSPAEFALNDAAMQTVTGRSTVGETAGMFFVGMVVKNFIERLKNRKRPSEFKEQDYPYHGGPTTLASIDSAKRR